MTEISLILPLPPSINVYWGFSGHKRFLTLQAREFKVQVAHIVSQQPIRFGNKRLDVNIVFHFKDKRRTDLDNYCKSLFDALTQANQRWKMLDKNKCITFLIFLRYDCRSQSDDCQTNFWIKGQKCWNSHPMMV